MPTNDELRAMAERLESLNWECHGAFEHGDDDTPHKAAVMLRSILAEREANEALDKKIDELGKLWAETGKDWDLTVSMSLTEPTCPSACVEAEDGTGRHRYLTWGNTIDEAIVKAVSQAHKELILKQPIVPEAPWTEKSDPSPLSKGVA